jgi:hypothetical protein
MKRREFIMVLGGRGGYVLPSTARGVRAAAGAVGLTLPITDACFLGVASHLDTSVRESGFR